MSNEKAQTQEQLEEQTYADEAAVEQEIEEYSGPPPHAADKMAAISNRQGDVLEGWVDPVPMAPEVANALEKHEVTASGLDMAEIMKGFKEPIKSKGPHTSMALMQDMSAFRAWLKTVESRVMDLATTSAYPTDEDHQRAFDLLKSEFDGHLRKASKHSAIYRNRITQGRVGSNPDRLLSAPGDIVGSIRVNAPQSTVEADPLGRPQLPDDTK